MSLADRMAVMEAGRIVQIGAPREIYVRPATRFVAGCIGDTNLFEGRVRQREGGYLSVETADGEMVAHGAPDVPSGATVWLTVRPEQIRLGTATGHNCLDVRALRVEYRGDQSILHAVTRSGAPLRLKGNNDVLAAVEIGTTVAVAWLPDDVAVLKS
jgi:ABC-type Fe3+/spermidine/putrescine transport system ATPase subunit